MEAFSILVLVYTFQTSSKGILGTFVTGGQALASCYGVAELYYQGVKERGGTAYRISQEHAQEEANGGTSRGFQIVSSGGLCLDPKDYGQSRVGNPLQLFTCNGEQAQTFSRR